jgi:putative thioredoxin
MVAMSSPNFSRHGAVDLSQLAQRAKTPAGGATPGRGGQGTGAGAAGASYVVEISDQSFEAEVVRRSMQHPVVVELYSPRVSTGAQLSDALAAVAAEAAGKVLVARLNVDSFPQVTSALGIQAVPTVIGVVGGQMVPLFQGVLPEAQVKVAIDQLLQAAVANGIVGRAEPVGGVPDEVADAEASDPRFAAADAALERGDFAAARDEFDKVLQASPGDAEALAGKAQAGLLARTAALDVNAVMGRASGPDADFETQLDAADVEMVMGVADAAFARLIGLIKASTGERRDEARTRLLELFETLGNTDERVLKARRDLMAALF